MIYNYELTCDEKYVRYKGAIMATVKASNPFVRPEQYARIFARAPQLVKLLLDIREKRIGKHDVADAIDAALEGLL